MKTFTQDYAINLCDGTGRRLTLPVNGASIDDAIAYGVDAETAKEQVQDNAFQNAVSRGEIGADAWLERL